MKTPPPIFWIVIGMILGATVMLGTLLYQMKIHPEGFVQQQRVSCFICVNNAIDTPVKCDEVFFKSVSFKKEFKNVWAL